MNKITVFLSHSSQDIQKVRKIRDILETLEYDPLVFHLKCLDDDNEQLESFIKKEIEARNIFIYCKSDNSEKSTWVQKELEYIRSFDSKRLFTIDITLPLRETLVQLLISITDIIKKNRVFISCSHGFPDKEFGNYIEKLLVEHNYDVIKFSTLDYEKYFEHKSALSEASIFISIISPNSLSSVYCKSELEYALFNYEATGASFKHKIIPIFYGISSSTVSNLALLPSSLNEFQGIETSNPNQLTAEEEKILFQLLK